MLTVTKQFVRSTLSPCGLLDDYRYSVQRHSVGEFSKRFAINWVSLRRGVGEI